MIRILACILISAGLAACASTKSSAPSTYVVFFPPNSAELPAEAKPALDRAAAAVKQTRPAHVAIAAGVARAGALPLAEPRYLAVRKALTDRGVSEGIIARASLPDTAAPVEAAGAQRVEIILDGK
jgi:outer membrane protein OmpA-like peptidoglycan-associated protein